jgi:hypothetical protein
VDGAKGGPAGVARNHALGRIRDWPLGIMTGRDAFADGEVIRPHEKRPPKSEKSRGGAPKGERPSPRAQPRRKVRPFQRLSALRSPHREGATRNEGEPGAFSNNTGGAALAWRACAAGHDIHAAAKKAGGRLRSVKKLKAKRP